MPNWIEIKALLATAPPDWSPLIEAFDRHGCPGTAQEDEPPSLSAYMAEVNGWENRVAALSNDLKSLGAREVQNKIVPEEDWSQNWKQFFKTRRVGQRIVIKPTWDHFEPGVDDVVITLDPGQAFGTGDHPTTRVCLELLERADPEGKTVADIGCGSGILAIAASKLGAKEVIASDLDEQSVEITKENAKLNGVHFPAVAAAGFEALNQPYDMALSNIISATLIRLAPDASKATKAGGRWIVSGIIETNWPDVRAAAERAGFTLEDRVQEDEWVGATFLR